MLRLECPQCKEWIHSDFIMDVEEVQCPACAASVKIKDVYISAGPFAIYRDVLLKHMFKYKRLLAEAEKELEDLRGEVKGRPYQISEDSIKVFINNLKEMLAGCRESFRINADGELGVSLTAGGKTRKGKLVNLSATGICIDVGDAKAFPQKGETVAAGFGDAKAGLEPFEINGEVMWTGRGTMVGVKFLKMDKKTQKSLLEYIKKKA